MSSLEKELIVHGKMCPTCGEQYVKSSARFSFDAVYDPITHINPYDCITFLKKEVVRLENELSDFSWSNKMRLISSEY